MALVGGSACALSLVTPVLALLLAAAAAAVLWRASRIGALLLIALALRTFGPDLDPPALPPLRAALAAPLLAAVPEPDASIAAGSLLGGRGALPRDVWSAFALTGTSHLLAASGFNITLAASALAPVLRPLGARAATLGTLAAAIAFAVVAGLTPSIARAAVMAAVATGASLLGRPRDTGLNALGAAAAALLIVSPRAVTDVGFLLSVSATAGLVLFAAPLEGRLPGPAWLRAQLAATLAATLASLPIAGEAFGRVSLVSPLVNVAVAPLIAPLMTATAVAVALGGVVPALGAGPAWCAYLLARALRAIVEAFAALPFASLSIAHGGVVCLALYAVAALILRVPRPRLAAPRVAPALAALAVATLALAWLAMFAADRPGGARLVALSVGQGDAFLLEAGGARVLIDGGPDGARTVRALGDALPPFAERVDVVVLTHSHADHGAGLTAVLERYEVGLAIEPARLEDNDVARAWHRALTNRGVALRQVARGDRVAVGALTLEVLAPFGDPADPLANLVLRARAPGLTALLLGDATERGQQDLLLRPQELRADVYAPPHHGAATPHADALVAAARPRVALLSLGAGNRYGHPAPPTLRALAEVVTLRTDRDGTLEVSVDGQSLRCRTWPSALPPLWGRLVTRSAPCT